jgi:hypothetical protein
MRRRRERGGYRDTFWQASDTTIAALHLFHNWIRTLVETPWIP